MLIDIFYTVYKVIKQILNTYKWACVEPPHLWCHQCVCVCVCVSQDPLQCPLWWVSSGMTSPAPFLRPSRRAAGPNLRPPSPRPPRCPDPCPRTHLQSPGIASDAHQYSTNDISTSPWQYMRMNEKQIHMSLFGQVLIMHGGGGGYEI